MAVATICWEYPFSASALAFGAQDNRGPEGLTCAPLLVLQMLAIAAFRNPSVMVPTLLDPEPRSLSGLMPWVWLLERIGQLNAERLQNLLQFVVNDIAVDLQPLASRIQRRYERADCEIERITEVVRAALTVGTITAFAADPIGGKAFATRKYAWGLLPLPHHEPIRSIEDGIFAIDASAYPNGSLDSRLANAPLFVSKKQVIDWFKLMPSSRVALRASAEALMADHNRASPNQPMRRQDFLDAMKEKHPSASGRQLKAVWGEVAPKAWKTPGTKAGTASRSNESDR